MPPIHSATLSFSSLPFSVVSGGVRTEMKWVPYVCEDDLAAWSDDGWTIYSIIVLSGLGGVHLRRSVSVTDAD